MLKNIQIQIILIFTILGIIIIAGMGFLFSNQLNNIDIISIEQSEQALNNEVANIVKTTIYSIGIFIVIAIIAIIFVSKVVISPIKRLTKNAKDIADGKKVDMNNISIEKPRNDIQDLVNAFNIMAIKLNDRFTEASRQKKQIETILLHMTDGIIAFDLDGEIIHINPAARKLLKLDDDDNNFDLLAYI